MPSPLCLERGVNGGLHGVVVDAGLIALVRASLPHGCEEPPSGEDTLDTDAGLEEAEVQWRVHARAVLTRARASWGAAKTSR